MRWRRLLGVRLFWMESGHGAVYETQDERDEDKGDEQAAKEKSAGMSLVGFEKQVVHVEIDTGAEELVPGDW